MKNQEQIGEMYKVFNMGHRMEIYLPGEFTRGYYVSESFGVDARIVGESRSM